MRMAFPTVKHICERYRRQPKSIVAFAQTAASGAENEGEGNAGRDLYVMAKLRGSKKI